MHGYDAEHSLKIATALTFAFFGVEVVGGIVSGSLSLLSDAGHMLRDVLALIISLGAIGIAKRVPTKTKTFGYHRIEIFAALLNGILLLGIGAWVLAEAYRRIYNPLSIESTTMLIVAAIGMVVNSYIAFKLHGSSDINVKSAYLHVITDTLSSAAVIVASIWIFFTNQTIVDAVLAAGIAVFMLYSAFKIVKDSVHILLEFVPKNVNLDEVIKDVLSVKGVRGIHNVHLWALCSNVHVFDAHVFTTHRDMLRIEKIKKEIKERLKKYNIKHATLEFECEECTENEIVKNIEH